MGTFEVSPGALFSMAVIIATANHAFLATAVFLALLYVRFLIQSGRYNFVPV